MHVLARLPRTQAPRQSESRAAGGWDDAEKPAPTEPDPEEFDDVAPVLPQGHITAGPEYRFMLLRHWTLYDAMLQSRYVATRMTLWRSNGVVQLKQLLAQMGVSLKEATTKVRRLRLVSVS